MMWTDEQAQIHQGTAAKGWNVISCMKKVDNPLMTSYHGTKMYKNMYSET